MIYVLMVKSLIKFKEAAGVYVVKVGVIWVWSKFFFTFLNSPLKTPVYGP